MRYGYVRDRLGNEQKFEEQSKMLGEVDIVIKDTDKSKLRDLVINKVKSGDSIHIGDISRITRKVEESHKLHEYLTVKGVELYVNGVEFSHIYDSLFSLMVECFNNDNEEL